MMSRSVVVQYDPGRRRRRLAVAVLLAVGLFLAGLWGGAAGNFGLYRNAAEENRELRTRLVRQARQLEELRQWRETDKTRREVDAAALELVRGELASHQETIAELERGIRFYKSLMSPAELAEGLNIRSVEVTPLDEPGRHLFRVLVQQSARKHRLMTGTLSVYLVGESEGGEVEYNLAELSEDVPNTDIRLRFKYFQAIDGELALPDGFVPQLVRVSASSIEPRRAEVSEEFPWSAQERR